MNFTEGYVKVARKIQESLIWYKPPEYLKIFEYFLFNVNYEDNGIFKAGEQYFNISKIRIPRVTEDQIRHFLRWACSKSVNMFAKRKTTRGIILKINNYALYQDFVNYKLPNNCQTTAKQLPNNCQMINNKQSNKEINITTTTEENFIKKNPDFKFRGEYKNVGLTDRQYNDLSVMIMNKKKLDQYIEELSEKIAEKTDSEKRFDFDYPDMHKIRLKKYWIADKNKNRNKNSSKNKTKCSDMTETEKMELIEKERAESNYYEYNS